MTKAHRHKVRSLLISIAVMATLAPAISFGNLGDNELKISQTYGNSAGEQKISQSLVERQYLSGGMTITVTFLNGTSQSETFKKVDGTPLNDDQIGKILEANANSLAWAPKASTAQNAREWIIAGPKPVSSGNSGGEPAVFAVSGRTPPSGGERLIAVDMLQTDDDSSSVPSAPPVLRKAIYKCAGTNNVLAVFTSAYESVSRHELPQKSPLPVPVK